MTEIQELEGEQRQKALLVLCTAPDADVAASLARSLVADGHAACVNILPGIRSIYRWQGEVEDSAEVQLFIKTTSGRWDPLCDAIAAQHPYEVPEILALEPAAVAPSYLQWLRES